MSKWINCGISIQWNQTADTCLNTGESHRHDVEDRKPDTIPLMWSHGMRKVNLWWWKWHQWLLWAVETDYIVGDFVGTENVLYISISICTGQAQTVHLKSVHFIICNLYLNTNNFFTL